MVQAYARKKTLPRVIRDALSIVLKKLSSENPNATLKILFFSVHFVITNAYRVARTARKSARISLSQFPIDYFQLLQENKIKTHF